MYVNLTPYEITILDKQSNILLRVPPSGQVARLKVSRQVSETIDGITVYETSYGAVEGLPPGENARRHIECDTFYIVSALVAQQVRNERGDVFAPGELVRDSGGNVVGYIGLSR